MIYCYDFYKVGRYMYPAVERQFELIIFGAEASASSSLLELPKIIINISN